MYEMMQMQGDYILVKMINEEKQTSGFYVPPSAADEKYQKAKVIAVKSDGNHDLVDFNYTVIFKQYVGYDMGNDYKVIEDKDILAIVADKKL